MVKAHDILNTKHQIHVCSTVDPLAILHSALLRYIGPLSLDGLATNVEHIMYFVSYL